MNPLVAAVGREHQPWMGPKASVGTTCRRRRLGGVDDIGYAALFLATEEAGYMTGQTIVIDGGQLLPETPEAIAAAETGG